MRKVKDSFNLVEDKAIKYWGTGKRFIKANNRKTPSNIGFTKARLVKGKTNV